MFVIIVRKTVPGTSGDWIETATEEISLAQDSGCAAIQTLCSLDGRQDLFAISNWTTRTAARRFIEMRAAKDQSLTESADGTELRRNPDHGISAAFHLLLLQEKLTASE